TVTTDENGIASLPVTSDKAGSVKVEAEVGGVTSTVTTDENGIASLPVTSDKAGSVKVEAEVGGVTSSTQSSGRCCWSRRPPPLPP
ncbi:hypothetical protein, partial [Serratia fonticola]